MTNSAICSFVLADFAIWDFEKLRNHCLPDVEDLFCANISGVVGVKAWEVENECRIKWEYFKAELTHG